MLKARRVIGVAIVAGVAVAAAGSSAQSVGIADPTKVVMVVNRDSNELAFLDIATRKMVGKVFLGNNANPHMATMSPDGRYAVTGGTRSNKAYIVDLRTLRLVKAIPIGIGPEHQALSPDGRFYYQGNPSSDSLSVIDMNSLTEVRRIEGLQEPLNITFTPDGSKAYVGTYGAHSVAVIDARRHELLKKIQIGEPPAVSKIDPGRYLGEIKGISNASISRDGRYLYAADGDLGVVGVIDTRDDKVVKVIKVGADPWRAYMSHDGKYAVVLNNGDETISIIDTATNKVAATLEAGPDMMGANFAGGKVFVISSSTSFVYAYDMQTLRPAGRIKFRYDNQDIQVETATTDAAGEKLYLAGSTNHSVFVIDARTHAVERIANVGLYPWGTHIMDSKDNYCH